MEGIYGKKEMTFHCTLHGMHSPSVKCSGSFSLIFSRESQLYLYMQRLAYLVVLSGELRLNAQYACATSEHMWYYPSDISGHHSKESTHRKFDGMKNSLEVHQQFCFLGYLNILVNDICIHQNKDPSPFEL